MVKIVSIIGTRPQFIKHAVLEPELKTHFKHISIHSGQHYDDEMSSVFFQELRIDFPTYTLKPQSVLHGQQTAEILTETEKILMYEKPNLVIIYGDSNTTLAGALAASKLNIPIAHIEAGMRSFNRNMPEETNRILTDHMANLLFTSSNQSIEQLKKEGVTGKIFNCGDLMKDLILIMKKRSLIKKNPAAYNKFYCTIHRPSNTDHPERLKNILDHLNKLDRKIVFPIHPRTKKMMERFNFAIETFSNIEFIKPQSYISNINNLYNFYALITDSGGMQKEAYFLKKRCVTIRNETEWTETLNNNWNTLAFKNLSTLNELIEKPLGKWDNNLYGNGDARKLIVHEIKKYLN